MRRLQSQFSPHGIISLSGYDLKSFNECSEVFVPHAAIDLPFNETPKQEALVPSHHFHKCPIRSIGRRLRQFYETRIRVTQVLDDKPQVLFQEKELIGPSFHELLGSRLVVVSSIPSEATAYLVNKFWEAMSCGSLLVAVLGRRKDLWESIGFEDGVHYISANLENVSEKVKWALDPSNRSVVDNIRKAGYAAVREGHMPKRRLEQIERMVQRYSDHTKSLL